MFIIIIIIMIQFKTKIWKTGSSYVLTVPFAYIKHGQLDEGMEYSIKIDKVKQEVDKHEHTKKSRSDDSNARSVPCLRKVA